MGLTREELSHVDSRLVASRRKVARGELLYEAGHRFESLFAVWTGFFKTRASSRDGRDQVTGFQMGGELLGLDGIDQGCHEVDAIALEDAQVCVIPFSALDALGHELPPLRQQFHRLMCREVLRHQAVMLLLGSRSAEERVAAFLLNLTQRLKVRGFSACDVQLRMTRVELGSYLGLTLETVSRTFSKFQSDGLLSVRQRHIRITDTAGLQRLVDGNAGVRRMAVPGPSRHAEPSRSAYS